MNLPLSYNLGQGDVRVTLSYVKLVLIAVTRYGKQLERLLATTVSVGKIQVN